jgi:DNA gyrase subunit A
LVAIKNVTDEDDLMIICRSGMTIRMPVNTIRVAGRATQGVKLINIREGDSIAAISVVAHSDEEESQAAEGTAVEE